jgi:hypothetical protein
LENAIAELEIELESNPQNGMATSAEPEEETLQESHGRLLSSSGSACTLTQDTASSAQVVSMLTLKCRKALSQVELLKSQTELPYFAILLGESHLPTPLCHPLSREEMEVRCNRKRIAGSTLPVAVARSLFDAYSEKVLPRYPFFARDDLESIFESVYCPGDRDVPAPPCNYFIVFQILAITTLTSRSTETQRIVSLAESLHAQALTYSNALATADIRCLQCLLLLIQQALLLPSTGDLVHLVNEAMRLAMELGLHLKSASPAARTSSAEDSRRKIFWVVRGKRSWSAL